ILFYFRRATNQKNLKVRKMKKWKKKMRSKIRNPKIPIQKFQILKLKRRTNHSREVFDIARFYLISQDFISYLERYLISRDREVSDIARFYFISQDFISYLERY